MDQAAFTHQGVFWRIGKCSEITNLDCGIGLCARRHHQKTPEDNASLYEILQILNLTMFEKVPLDQLLAQTVVDEIQQESANQLFLFD